MNHIYRVEDDFGKGCYCELMDILKFLWNHTQYNGHPKAFNDNGINRHCKSEEIHGFKDLEQAKRWFKPCELIKMKKHGYKLQKVEVKQITAVGEHQVLAIR